jgi:small subunit ribosomal protein S17
MTTKPTSTEAAGRRKSQEGRVVSDHMDKTVIVSVERRVQHRLYRKAVRESSKFAAHDENNAYQIGDTVRIMETRPLSKTKRWRVTALLVRQDLPEIEPAVAAQVSIEESTVAPRRRGPTKAARTAAARRVAAGEAPVSAPVAAKPEPEAAPVEEEAAVEEAAVEEVTEEVVAEVEEPAVEADAPAEEAAASEEEEPVAEAAEAEEAVEATEAEAEASTEEEKGS